MKYSRIILLLFCMATPCYAANLYVDTGGSATNSGSTDVNTATVSGSAATVSGAVVTLPGGTNLSTVDGTAGSPTQSTIYLAQATNATRKIFWIVGVNDAADTVTVEAAAAPTGVTSSNWAIGGRILWTAANVESALRAGDTLIFNNSPAAVTGSDFLTCRVSGTAAAGYITVKGKTGVMPKLNVTDTNQVIEGNSQILWQFENLEIDQDGASGNVVQSPGRDFVFYNIKISDGGAIGFASPQSFCKFINCEVTGILTDAFNTATANLIHGCKVHDIGGNGVNWSGTVAYLTVTNSIFDTCTGRGIYASGAPTDQNQSLTLIGNTIYGNSNSGLEVVDSDYSVTMINNIFSENGNGTNEANIEWTSGTAEVASFHAWNVFHHTGGGGAVNLLSCTAGAFVAGSEPTTSPLFTDAPNGDFSISSGSSAKATGYPGVFLGGSTGFIDIGAVQRQEAAAGPAVDPINGGPVQ